MEESQRGRGRRGFVAGGALWGAGLVLGGCAASTAGEPGKTPAGRGGEPEEEEVSPAEDLMREHGVLERALIVYEATLLRFGKNDASPLPVIASTAKLIRRFVEDYHEKLEEQFVFPRLEAAHTLADLVATLRAQHDRGRALTDDILRLAGTGGASATAEDGPLAARLRGFIRMYRPHAAREDTVLFPAFREIVKGHEYGELGERFEDKEHALFGKRGFEGIVEEIASLEKALGIDDLASFTPPA